MKCWMVLLPRHRVPAKESGRGRYPPDENGDGLPVLRFRDKPARLLQLVILADPVGEQLAVVEIALSLELLDLLPAPVFEIG
jgi:hypothetical protein